MVQKRFEVTAQADPRLLAESVHFKSSGRTAKNRFLKSALSEYQATYEPENLKANGIPSERLIRMYSKFGHGGLGILITGNVMIDHKHLEGPHNVIISQETDSVEKTERLRQMAEACKADGALALVQLGNAGRQTPFAVNPTPFSASDVQLTGLPRGRSFGAPIPIPAELIQKEVIDRFVFAAKKAKQVGFDGVELHGAHGYLLAQFLSPTTNKRTDQYGGTPENRVRIIKEIVHAIRKEIPASTGFVLGIKINSVEFQDGGINLDDVIYTARALDNIGLDFIELSGGNYEKTAFFHPKDSTKKRESFFGEFAKAVKPEIKNAVVYLTGGFRTLSGMTQAIQNGETDGIGIGRPITAEPDLPEKIVKGKVESAAFNFFDHDFAVSLAQSNTQMGEAGNSTWEESKGDASYGITDFSNEAEAQEYEKALAEHRKNQQPLAKNRYGIFEYKTKISV